MKYKKGKKEKRKAKKETGKGGIQQCTAAEESSVSYVVRILYLVPGITISCFSRVYHTARVRAASSAAVLSRTDEMFGDTDERQQYQRSILKLLIM